MKRPYGTEYITRIFISYAFPVVTLHPLTLGCDIYDYSYFAIFFMLNCFQLLFIESPTIAFVERQHMAAFGNLMFTNGY